MIGADQAWAVGEIDSKTVAKFGARFGNNSAAFPVGRKKSVESDFAQDDDDFDSAKQFDFLHEIGTAAQKLGEALQGGAKLPESRWHRRFGVVIIKLAALRAKFEDASAGDYAAENKSFLKAVIEEIFPEKRCRIYGKSGRAVQPELDAIVLNTAL